MRDSWWPGKSVRRSDSANPASAGHDARFVPSFVVSTTQPSHCSAPAAVGDGEVALGPGGVERLDLAGDVLGHLVLGSGHEAHGGAHRPDRRPRAARRGVASPPSSRLLALGDGVEHDGHGTWRVEVVVHPGREGGQRGGVGFGVRQSGSSAGEGVDPARARAAASSRSGPTCTGER